MDHDLAPSSADDLIAGVRDRDPGALAALYDRTAPLLLELIRRIVGNAERAEGLLQDVFVSVWHQAPGFDGRRTRTLTWLVMLARQAALDAVTLDRRLRLAVGAPPAPRDVEQVDAPHEIVPDEDEQRASATAAALLEAFDTTPPRRAAPDAPLPQRAAERRARDARLAEGDADDPLERALAQRRSGAGTTDLDQALRVAEALRGVDRTTRRCVSLAFFDGLRAADIAPRVDEPACAVRGRIRQALARIRYSLAGADALARR